MNDEKYSAYQSLYNALKSMLQVMAPVIPYMTDYIWMNLIILILEIIISFLLLFSKKS